MNKCIFFLILILSLCMIQCAGPKKPDSNLIEAARIHNDALLLAKQLKQQLEQLTDDSTYVQDSVKVWRAAIDSWEKNLVEVPGNESAAHFHASHAHNHEQAIELTASQMLTVQQEMNAQLEAIKRRINSRPK